MVCQLHLLRSCFKYTYASCSSSSIPEYIPKINKSIYLYKNLDKKAQRSIIHNSQKSGNTPNVHQLMNKQKKLWYLYTMEYYSIIRRNEVLIHATVWMSLENIKLSERNKSQKVIYYIILFT